jgi:peptidoglycan/LPS O-acetylase OafA/YrhL
LNSVTLNYPTSGPGRVQLFDELRGLAILLVLMYHVGGVTGFPNRLHGDVGVDIFVLISGAALTFSHRPEEGSLKFLWRRLVRVLPVYWIALTVFWQGGVRLLGRAHAPTEIWSHYFCIHPWWGDQYILSISDSFWFLGLIVPLYFVYAALRRFLDRMDLVVGVGLTLAFILTYCTVNVWGQPATFVHLGLRPPIFFIGLLFGQMLRTGSANIRLTGWIGLGVLLSWYGTFLTGLLVGYNIAGFAVFFAYFAFRANAEAAGRRWLCRGLGALGLVSYEIFLIHQPLIREYNHYIWNRLGYNPPDPIRLAVGVAVALALTLPLALLLRWIGQRIARVLVR